MSRSRRLKVKGEIAYYHILSRTVGQQFLLGDPEKEELFKIINHFAGMYFVEILALTIMSNHFHLAIKSDPHHLYSDKDVARRIEKYIFKKHNRKQSPDQLREVTGNDILKARQKLEDISEFTRSIKQTFSCWYNKTRNRTGYLWGDRFKSLLLETGDSVLRCCAYIELNPVRAGIVAKPESYRWCSLHYREFARNREQFFSYDGMFPGAQGESQSQAALHQAYRSVVYYCGNIKRTTLRDLEEGRTTDDAKSAISDNLYEQESLHDFKLPSGVRLLGRVRHFSDGAVIGSKEFLVRAYALFGGTVIQKKDRNVYPTGIAPGIFSIRRLTKLTTG